MTTQFNFPKLLFVAALAAPLAASAAPGYTIKVVAPAGSTAKGINGSGQVVGSLLSHGNAHAFLYTGARLLDLGTLGGPTSVAYGINDIGVVVGEAVTASGKTRAFSFSHGRMTDIGTLGGEQSWARSINNAGVITGFAQSRVVKSFWGYAFRYQNGHMHNLGTLPGGEGSFAYKINNHGVIAGAAYEGPYSPPDYPNYPTIYRANSRQKISAYEGEANGINDKGQVVGGVNTYDLPLPHGRKAYLYDSGRMVFLGFLESANQDSSAVAINNLGEVIGYSLVTTGPANSDYRPFIYTEQGGMRSLNALVDTSTGWEVISADAINDQRQIAGTACKAGKCYAVRLDPIQ
jgi:probable HAF family extracellular repeat protein